MKRKKSLLVLLFCAMLFVLSACSDSEKGETKAEIIESTEEKESGKPKTTEATKAVEETEEIVQEPVGMPNPMKEIGSSEEFEKELGIKIIAENISTDPKMFIINDKIADIRWHMENVSGEDVVFILRATKDSEAAEMLHGIYDDNMSEEIVNNIPLTEDKSIELHFKKAETENCGIYTFKDGNIYYSLTYNNDMSQMALAEILDRVMLETGIMYHKDVVQALPVSNEITDGIYPAQFEKDWVYHVDDKYLMECDLYAEEYFDSVEVNLLREGDSMVLDGDMVYEISSIEEKDNGEIAIVSESAGEEFFLTPAEGGTYKVRGYNDLCTYSFVASGKFNISKKVRLRDTSDIENGCPEIVVEGDKEVYEYIQNNEKLHPGLYSTTVQLEGKLVTEIDVRYVP